MVETVWDPRKDAANFEKHKLRFNKAALIWNGIVFEKPSTGRDDGEDRYIAFGMVEDRVLAVVYTWRDNKRRLISARKANQREQRYFKEALSRLASDESG